MRTAGRAAGLAAAVISIAAAAGAATDWAGTRIIDAGTGYPAWEPAVAVNAGGSGVAIFNQSNGTINRVWANRFTGSGGWAGAVAIDSGSSGNAQGGGATVDSSGGIIAVFTEYDMILTRHRICANRYTDGWAGMTVIDNGALGDSWDYSIAGNPDGNAMAVFAQASGGGAPYRVYARRFVAGQGWETSTQMIDATDQTATDVAVAMNQGGEACAVFTQGTPGAEKIYANRYSPGTGWAGAILIDTADPSVAMTPRVAVDPSGAVYATWRKGFPGTVYVNRWSGSAWSGPVQLDDGGGNQARDPVVAVDAKGGAVVAFAQWDPSVAYDRIYANRWDGAAWAGPVRLDPQGVAHAMLPAVALDAEGNGYVLYVESDGTVPHIWAVRYDAGAGWGAPLIIDSQTGMGTSSPCVAIDGTGDALAVFQDNEGGVPRVRANFWPAPPIDLTVNKSTFSSSDHIAVTADVQALATPFFPFVRLVMPNGSTLYFSATRGLTASVAPYLDGGPFTLADAIDDYPIVETDFAGVAQGTYRLEGGAVDAAKTTSVDNLIYLGGVDTETLVVN